MSWPRNLDRGNWLAALIGAAIGVIAIRTQPDGNLLVTSFCALAAGGLSLAAWIVVKKLRGL